ncbi:MAG: MerR family transcriptional regulator [Lachnospiraceae bacterium]|nr:MerR family transcriptional regulator [Lachnospiraceae bacterium]
MTIKEFAALVECNPQTLRYYDKENLLKPVKVDEWTGYRYYEADQALDFVKIKNLQNAGFTIDEIKKLANADNETILAAFDEKIREQKEKLNKTIEISKSYQNEMTMMKNKLDALRKMMGNSFDSFDPTEEFGIDKETYDEIVKDVKECLDESKLEACIDILNNVDIFPENIEEEFEKDHECNIDFFNSSEYELVYEKHDWSHVKDFFDEFSFEKAGEYAMLFKTDEERAKNFAFINTVLALAMKKNENIKKKVSCNVHRTEDGENHFWLFKVL